MKIVIIILAVILIAFTLIQIYFISGQRNIETYPYVVIKKYDRIEIRSYEATLFTSVKLSTKGYENSSRKGFSILAGYIFGDNEAKQKISMTAPVVQAPSTEVGPSEKISMTAPVVQSPVKSGWEMSFMMPSKYSMEDLPRPKDSRIQIHMVPEKTVAVIRFSGLWSEEKNNLKAQALKDWLIEKNQYETVSEAMFAGYNPPWTLPFLRRNEMMIEVRPKKTK